MRNIYKETIRLANNTKLSPKLICKKVGISPRWLSYFKRGEFADAGYNRVHKLYMLLKPKPKKEKGQ